MMESAKRRRLDNVCGDELNGTGERSENKEMTQIQLEVCETKEGAEIRLGRNKEKDGRETQLDESEIEQGSFKESEIEQGSFKGSEIEQGSFKGSEIEQVDAGCTNKKSSGLLPDNSDDADAFPPSHSHFVDAHATGEDEMSRMLVYVQHEVAPTASALGRPARKQLEAPPVGRFAYVEGREDYNIWYDKFLTRREDVYNSRQDREPAVTRCNPFIDSGWTRANFEIGEVERPVICLFFAKGACSLGAECRYLHRLPTREDDDKLDMLHDIFGRERHASHRDDMDGTGCFNSDCLTLFVGDLRINRLVEDFLQRTETLLRQTFGLWGPIESLRVIPNKSIAFIKFTYRAAAEFAKVAMSQQPLDASRGGFGVDNPEGASDENGVLSVRWAYPNRNPRAEELAQKEKEEARQRAQAKEAVERRMRELGYTDDEIQHYGMWGALEGGGAAVGAYPSTSGIMGPDTWLTQAHKEAEEARIAAAAEELEARRQEGFAAVERLSKMQEVLSRTANLERLGEADFEVSL